MTLNANALTTLATVKEELSINSSDPDGRLERMINVVSQSVERAIQRPLYSQAGIVEAVAGFGDTFLHVEITPLTDITSITLDGITIADTDYEIYNAGTGSIFKPTGWSDTASVLLLIEAERMPGMERKLYEITYDGGWVTPEQGGSTTLPGDIEDAVIQAVASRYRSLGRDGNISEERLEAWSAKYGRKTKAELSGSAFSPELTHIIDHYKRAAFA